jgi:osmotically-inducible protein OsmY
VIGSTKADEFVIDLSDLIGEGKSGTVNLSGIDASDTITVNDDGALGDADEADLATALSAAVTGVASTDGEATISFSYSNDKLTLNVDTAMDELDIINREFDHLASS